MRLTFPDRAVARNLIFKIVMATALIFSAVSSPAQSETWPRNILPGDYPDPTILRDGSDYYMTHSPFVYTPGFLIWHSKDLIHWQPIARAMTNVVGSAMAPDLVKYQGKYYIYFPASGTNWVIWANDIRGPWSKPIQLEAGRIDPGHAVGEDGERYLFLSAGGRVSLSHDGLSVSGPIENVYAGWEYPKEWITEGMWLESPKIFHKGDYFYMVSAQGGTAGPPTSHMIVVARSKSIDGPWENSPYNPIVHTYSADEQWWSKGHGTVIDDVNGNWWVVYHAYEKGQYPLGRQTLLDPIEWLPDGWFRLAKTPHPLPSINAPVSDGMKLSDDFSGKNLGLQWMTWQHYAPESIKLKKGSLYLKGKGTNPANGQLLLVTATDHSYEIETEVTVKKGMRGGLILFYREEAFAGIASDGEEIIVYQNATKERRQINTLGNHFFLKITKRQNLCDFLVSGNGKTWTTVQTGVDVSQMHHNKFLGFFALRPGRMAIGEGEVRFKRFQYRLLPSTMTSPVTQTTPQSR